MIVFTDGRGRAFVEDEPASIRTLARVGERLVSIHGQNSEQELVEFDASTNLNVAKSKFYNGAIVVPRLNFVIKTKNGDGVKAYLDMVFATVGKDGKPGKKIGGISAAEAFKGYIGEMSSEDPTGGQGASDLDDEIPF